MAAVILYDLSNPVGGAICRTETIVEVRRGWLEEGTSPDILQMQKYEFFPENAMGNMKNVLILTHVTNCNVLAVDNLFSQQRDVNQVNA